MSGLGGFHRSNALFREVTWSVVDSGLQDMVGRFRYAPSLLLGNWQCMRSEIRVWLENMVVVGVCGGGGVFSLKTVV